MGSTSGVRPTVVVVAVVAGLLAGSVVAIAAGADPAEVDPPPRMAFVARSDVAADALAVGPVAGRYDAPLFTTPSTSLADEARDGLIAHGPEKVVIAGGTGAISAGVEAEIKSALGLADHQVVRAAGANRHDTAALIAAMLDDHDSAFRVTVFEDHLAQGEDLTGYNNQWDTLEIMSIDELPAGTYLVTGNVFANGLMNSATASAVNCRATLGDHFAWTHGRIGSDPGHVSAISLPITLVASIEETDSLTVDCFAAGGVNSPRISGGGTRYTTVAAVRVSD